MTLLTEQCIEVAEKVWGFVRKYDDQDKRYMWFGPDDGFEDRYLQEEIDSWEGFGRTWEYFRDKYSHCVTIDFFWHEDAQGWACNIGVDIDYRFSGYGGTQFDAIHDAGLKAAGDLLDGQQHHQSPEAR